MSLSRAANLTIPYNAAVLIVEPDTSILTTRGLLFEQTGFHVVYVKSYIDLLEVESTVSINVAVLSDSLEAVVLDKIARFIRRQWPRSRILIIGNRGIEIDDQLYDEAMDHQSRPEKLIDAICKQSKYGFDAH